MSSRRRWCDSFDPVQVRVQCGDAVHRVTWRRGKVVLEDHPSLTAERSVAALGAPECPCMAILAVWAAGAPMHRVALDRLTASEPPPTPHGDVLRIVTEAEFAAMRHRSAAPVADPNLWRLLLQQERERYLEVVAHLLPSRLLARFHLGVVLAAGRRWDDIPSDFRVDNRATLSHRVREAVHESMDAWRRPSRAVPRTVEVRVVAPAAQHRLSGRIDRRRARADVELGVSWLVTVWARGMAVVDGCFVLGASDGTDDVKADVVRWERDRSGASEPVTVPGRLRRDGAGRWRLRWA